MSNYFFDKKQTMRIKPVWIYICLTTYVFSGCQGQSLGFREDTNIVALNRFDEALLQWIESDNPQLIIQLKEFYPQMLDLLGKSLFQSDTMEIAEYYDKLINYYSEPTLLALYKDAVRYYADDSTRTIHIAKKLSDGFKQIKKLFPSMQIPAVYMHVSGLQQNMIVADSLLSCSIDKYMGMDYPLYADCFYDYQRRSMVPERIAIDGLNVWLQSEYPYHGRDNVLLERMVYEGKIIYTLMQLGVDFSYENIMSLTKDEYRWLRDYESALWTTIIERQHLYTPDISTTLRYFQPSPSTFITDQAPGNLGCYIGYRIIECYMKRTKSTCAELMKNNDAQDILKKAKYKP